MGADPSSPVCVLGLRAHGLTSLGLGFLACDVGVIIVPAWLCRRERKATGHLDCREHTGADVRVLCLS